MKSILVVRLTPYFRPGSRSFSPAAGFLSTASCMSEEKFMPNIPSTHTVMIAVAAMSSTALIIWTQVVPFMPPIIT